MRTVTVMQDKYVRIWLM